MEGTPVIITCRESLKNVPESQSKYKLIVKSPSSVQITSSAEESELCKTVSMYQSAEQPTGSSAE